ncbi:hypothetical protein [Paenibacillus sacheonensis]|uniref:Uncharacterized protein n=1 Tax=Paenibacillus sacheonensis TaxID=742054 RepID=A0A7X4YQA5_9BACL|nr:hypothetical protein [Paenibacillus sacheonensis]MBM7566355.1 hypothetical protein [Paenibacillus sacheonensis]NBC70558.1 hypothetical protein [Paenibacillus sacheonensis]
MRTIYENYRGFKVFQQTNSYVAIPNKTDDDNQDIMFRQWQLIEVLNTIDAYIEN